MLSQTYNEVTPELLETVFTKINDHNLQGLLEDTNTFYYGRLTQDLLVYRYPSTGNFPRYSLSEPADTIYQDTWYEENDFLAVYLLDHTYEFSEELGQEFLAALQSEFTSDETHQFYFKLLKVESFMNLPIQKVRWIIFGWCNGDALIISFEPDSGVIGIDSANNGAVWGKEEQDSLAIIRTLIETKLNLQ